nr:TPA_asm: hypothetical protein [Tilapia lake virus]DBA09003.1 TPA_asm: hypothetical protein [Tilapia lake virus]
MHFYLQDYPMSWLKVMRTFTLVLTFCNGSNLCMDNMWRFYGRSNYTSSVIINGDRYSVEGSYSSVDYRDPAIQKVVLGLDGGNTIVDSDGSPYYMYDLSGSKGELHHLNCDFGEKRCNPTLNFMLGGFVLCPGITSRELEPVADKIIENRGSPGRGKRRTIKISPKLFETSLCLSKKRPIFSTCMLMSRGLCTNCKRAIAGTYRTPDGFKTEYKWDCSDNSTRQCWTLVESLEETHSPYKCPFAAVEVLLPAEIKRHQLISEWSTMQDEIAYKESNAYLLARTFLSYATMRKLSPVKDLSVAPPITVRSCCKINKYM